MLEKKGFSFSAQALTKGEGAELGGDPTSLPLNHHHCTITKIRRHQLSHAKAKSHILVLTLHNIG